jgi:hypothetical protein
VSSFLTYRAHAERADGQPYAALVSRGYVRRSGQDKIISNAGVHFALRKYHRAATKPAKQRLSRSFTVP